MNLAVVLNAGVFLQKPLGTAEPERAVVMPPVDSAPRFSAVQGTAPGPIDPSADPLRNAAARQLQTTRHAGIDAELDAVVDPDFLPEGFCERRTILDDPRQA